NPFVPKKNAKTGRWHEPKFSLRRQADLVKKAHLSDTMNLIPPGPKKAAFELRMRRKVPGAELGIRLYAGKKRMFKGHLWERQQAKRIRKRSILMRDMAARVARYK
ncbi:hypothetical protein M413DRAFT_42864, partial [Hebeloma cylindrosporum]